MSAEWTPPRAEWRLTGTVTYRCATCGELIEDAEPVLWPLEDGEPLSISRSYHPDHLPQPHTMEVTNGS